MVFRSWLLAKSKTVSLERISRVVLSMAPEPFRRLFFVWVLADLGLPLLFLVFDDLVAVAGGVFEFCAVYDADAAAGVLDQS